MMPLDADDRAPRGVVGYRLEVGELEVLVAREVMLLDVDERGLVEGKVQPEMYTRTAEGVARMVGVQAGRVEATSAVTVVQPPMAASGGVRAFGPAEEVGRMVAECGVEAVRRWCSGGEVGA
jgi:hypothetical protein